MGTGIIEIAVVVAPTMACTMRVPPHAAMAMARTGDTTLIAMSRPILPNSPAFATNATEAIAPMRML